MQEKEKTPFFGVWGNNLSLFLEKRRAEWGRDLGDEVTAASALLI